MAKRARIAELGPAGEALHPDDTLTAEDIAALTDGLSVLLDALADEFETIPNRQATAGRADPRPVRSPFLQRLRDVRFGRIGEQPFDAEWLALRERFDAGARNRVLAHRFAASLPERVTLLELGAGMGSLFRWLAPIIARPQHWLWLDIDPLHLRCGLLFTADWGRRLGYQVELANDQTCLTLHARSAAWTIETVVCDLNDPASSGCFTEAQAVVCSALLDLFGHAWLEDLLDSIDPLPFYAAMNVGGRQWCNRQDPGDAMVLHGYAYDQIGGGRIDLTGPKAAAAVESWCRRNARSCIPARSDWTIGPHAYAMLIRIIAFQAKGARNALPNQINRIDAWEARRRRDIAAGRLAMRILHRDLLITGPEKGSRHAARRRR